MKQLDERTQPGRLKLLDSKFEDWLSYNKRVNPNYRLLTNDQLSKLRSTSWKNVKVEGLSGPEKTAKKEIHLAMSNALYDIEQLIALEIIDPTSPWRPISRKDPGDDLVISEKVLEGTFPIEQQASIVRGLVRMFGEKYALKLTEAIKLGIMDRDWEIDQSTKVEINLIKSPSSVQGFHVK